VWCETEGISPVSHLPTATRRPTDAARPLFNLYSHRSLSLLPGIDRHWPVRCAILQAFKNLLLHKVKRKCARMSVYIVGDQNQAKRGSRSLKVRPRRRRALRQHRGSVSERPCSARRPTHAR